MESLGEVLRATDAELESEFEARLRARLAEAEPAWLVEQLVERVLRERHDQARPHRELSRRAEHVDPPEVRRRRLDRIRARGLDGSSLRAELERFQALPRATLETEGYLVDPPHKGLEALGSHHRSPRGEDLLRDAHDLFYALLFCDEAQGVGVGRGRREFLTVTLPSAKAGALERFMLAVTEVQVAGTWLDPEGVSDDVGARNTVLQVEYGDAPDGLVSDALVATLAVLNDLEVNEEILYARIEHLDRSTLIS